MFSLTYSPTFYYLAFVSSQVSTSCLQYLYFIYFTRMLNDLLVSPANYKTRRKAHVSKKKSKVSK